MKTDRRTPREPAAFPASETDGLWVRESVPEGRVLRYRSTGAVEGEEVGRFEAELGSAARDRGSMILDVSGIEYFDEAATEVLVRLDERLRRRGDVLVLAGIRPLCLEVFQLTGIDCALTLAHDLPHARVLLAKRAQGRERWH